MIFFDYLTKGINILIYFFSNSVLIFSNEVFQILFHQRTLAPALEKLADNEQSFSEFCNAVFGRGLMTNPQPMKTIT